MRQLTVLAVAVLACVAYAMQAQAGSPPPCCFDTSSSQASADGPEFENTKDTESAP